MELRLYPTCEEQHNENNDEEAGAATDIMIAGTEAVAAATNEQYNEKNEKEVHGGLREDEVFYQGRFRK